MQDGRHLENILFASSLNPKPIDLSLGRQHQGDVQIKKKLKLTT